MSTSTKAAMASHPSLCSSNIVVPPGKTWQNTSLEGMVQQSKLRPRVSVEVTIVDTACYFDVGVTVGAREKEIRLKDELYS